MINEHL